MADELVSNLQCFIKRKKKVHLLCCSFDALIHNLSYLVFTFLHNKLKVRNLKKTVKRLKHIAHHLRKLANKTVSVKQKRKILTNFAVRSLLFPEIKKKLFPSLCIFLNKDEKLGRSNKKIKKKKKLASKRAKGEKGKRK